MNIAKIPLREDIWVSCTSVFEAHVSIMKTTLQCNAFSFFLAAKNIRLLSEALHLQNLIAW